VGSFVEKITGFFRSGDGGEGYFKKNRAKLLNVLVMVGAAGVLLMVLANAFNPVQPESRTEIRTETPDRGVETARETDPVNITAAEEMLNRRLEEVLTRIEGVGEVKAAVNLASTTEMDYAVNTTASTRKTDEKDPRGGNRTITEVNENGQLVLLRESESSKEAPVVVKEIKPEVRGVMVVAEGAGDPRIKAELVYALQVFLDVPVHKVVVLPKESR